jgi:transposase
MADRRMTSDNGSEGVIRMARKVYTSEFKQSAVSLVTEQNYKPEEAAKNLGINAGTLKYWIQVHRRGGGVVDPAEQVDLRKRNAELEREVARLRMERDILKKAAAFFAKESS